MKEKYKTKKKIPETLKIWMILNNVNSLNDLPKCLECEKNLVIFHGLGKLFGNYCKFCSKTSQKVVEKRRETIRKRFGVDHHLQRRDILEKQLNTLKERYGGTGFQSPIIRERIFKTLKERYGINTYKSLVEHNIPKIKQTNIKKYGTTCPMNTKEQIEKRRELLKFMAKKKGENKIRETYESYGLKNVDKIRYYEEFISKNIISEKFYFEYFKKYIKFFGEIFDTKLTYKENHIIKIGNKKYEIDFFIPELNIAIEVNGITHYNNNYTIIKDQEKEKRFKDSGIVIKSIPYFIYPSVYLFGYIFDIEVFDKIPTIYVMQMGCSIPDGFYYPLSGKFLYKLPSTYSELGIERFINELSTTFNYAFNDIKKSIEILLIKSDNPLKIAPRKILEFLKINY